MTGGWAVVAGRPPRVPCVRPPADLILRISDAVLDRSDPSQPMPDWQLTLATLLLVLSANAAPALIALLVRSLPGGRRMPPLDGGRCLVDGRRALGSSKTWPGLGAALVATTGCAMLLGLPWSIGLGVGAAAMTGDLIASLVKRRIGLASGSPAPLLDQVPESMLPALLVGLDWIETAIVVAAFVAIDLLLTPLFKRLASRS